MTMNRDTRPAADPAPALSQGPSRLSRRLALQRAGGWAVAGIGGLAGLSACTRPVPPLRVGSIMFPSYELMFLARELGALDQRLLRLIEMPSNTDSMRALAVGQIDAAPLTMDELLTAVGQGVDLRAVLVMDVSAGADVVLGLKGVDKLSDLRGRRVAVEDSAVGALMLEAALSAGGLRVDEIEKMPITLDRSVEVASKRQVHAVVTVEPWASRIEALGARRLFDSAAIPDRIIDVLAVREEVLDSHAVAISALVRGWFAGLQHFKQQPARAAEVLGPRLQLPVDQVQAAYRGLELMDASANGRLMLPGGRLAAAKFRIHDLMLKSALLERPLAIERLVDGRFLPG